MTFPSLTLKPILHLISLGLAFVSSLSAESFFATDSNRILDLSGTGRYILQRDGFSIPGSATTNLSVLDFETKDVDPVNFDPEGNFVAADRGTISSDGRYVVFESADYKTIYLRDRVTASTQIISNAADGSPQDGLVLLPSISPDGRRVVFFTNATNLVQETLPVAGTGTANLILWDRDTGALSLAARTSTGDVLNAGVAMDPGLCMKRFSADGRYIVFGTPATNAVPGATVTNGALLLMYRRDLDTGELRLVSEDPSGNLAAANYTYPAISNDGSRIAFITTIQGIFGDPILPGTEANFGANVMLKDLNTGAVIDLSHTLDGKAPDGFIQGTWGRGSSPLSMSGDGRLIAYQSNSGNLAEGNEDKRWGVFLAAINPSGSADLYYLTAPTDGSLNDSEAANPIFARESGLLAFVSDDREKFGLAPGEGWVFFGEKDGESFILNYMDPGSTDYGNGVVYSPSLAWLEFNGESGWAYSYTFKRHIFLDPSGPGVGNDSGYWMYVLDGDSSFWAFTSAGFWLAYGDDQFRNAYLYIASGLEGTPAWYYYYGEYDYFQRLM